MGLGHFETSKTYLEAGTESLQGAGFGRRQAIPTPSSLWHEAFHAMLASVADD